MTSLRRFAPAPSRQGGVAMLFVLVFTLALTGIAIVSARLALQGEAVARNQLDLQVARQAAEAALRDAEIDLLLPTGNPRTGAPCGRGDERPTQAQISKFETGCIRGQCVRSENQRLAVNYRTASATNQAVAEPWWPTEKGGSWGDDPDDKPSRGSNASCATFTGSVPLGTFTGTPAIRGVALQPEYLIEYVRRGGGGDNDFFRITARGFGYRAGTEVVMQSYFKVPPS
ncbi:MAG: pilus assembly protein PilX [Burkholderiales bacterium]|nr:pilus assembly protein PilX [Burkholderiales bacterium]MBH2017723.1 pilus assembly protein PilX [Burkholderiales bacterium]